MALRETGLSLSGPRAKLIAHPCNKLKAVRVFDSVCDCVVRSLLESCDLWYDGSGVSPWGIPHQWGILYLGFCLKCNIG